MNLAIGKNFRITKKINQGSFGEIYLGVNLKNNREVAVKLESLKTKNPQLQYEAKLLAYILGENGKKDGFPRLFYFGKDQNYSIMVMELLGCSLQELFQRCEKKFDLKTTVMVGIQIINRLQYLHKNKFVHRDIKPQNFLLGTHEKCAVVHLIDFGLSKKYLQKTGEHIPYKDNKSLTGTPRYASMNSHLGIEQGRRDDIQSTIYMLIYFMKGCLPWQNLKQDQNYGRYQKILEKKLSVSLENLTSGLPSQFGQVLDYARNLHFTEEPDYNLIRNLLEQALLNTGKELNENDLFCWEEGEEETLYQKEKSQQVEKDKEKQEDFDFFGNSQEFKGHEEKVEENKDDFFNFDQF